MTISKNARIVIWLSLAFVLAFSLAFASVPFYSAFCAATGFDGTAIRATKAPTNVPLSVSSRIVRVHFDTNVNSLNWDFKPEKPYLDTPVGKTALTYFSVKNRSDHAITARATFNVLPETLGPNFRKIQCFCFSDQTLQPGEEKTFSVVYFIAPEALKDPDTKDINDATLSYTFFESKKQSK